MNRNIIDLISPIGYATIMRRNKRAVAHCICVWLVCVIYNFLHFVCSTANLMQMSFVCKSRSDWMSINSLQEIASKNVHLPLILSAYTWPCDHVSVVSICVGMLVWLSARWGVHACVCVCLCYLHLIRFVYIWYVQRSTSMYIVQVLQVGLTDWLIAWIEYFLLVSHAINAFVFLILFIHLFTINVRSFFHFFCWIDFSLSLSPSILRICLSNGHLINDTRWWNVQYIIILLCATFVRYSWNHEHWICTRFLM